MEKKRKTNLEENEEKSQKNLYISHQTKQNEKLDYILIIIEEDKKFEEKTLFADRIRM